MTQKISTTVLAVLAALSLRAEEMKSVQSSYFPPDVALSDQVIPSYNRSARIAVDGSCDRFGDVSFIYWSVGEDYLDIAKTMVVGPPVLVFTIVPPPSASVPTQPFDYQPGFKIGLGFGTFFDNWELQAEYTYLHQSNTLHVGSSATQLVVGDPILIPNEWYVNLSSGGQQMAGHMSSKWKMNLDMIDLFLSRPYYEGQRLSVTPYGGLRGLWLRQRFNVSASMMGLGNLTVDTTPSLSLNSSKGWAIGPVGGANFHWLLGMGFRIEFDLGLSLLYMRYTTLEHKESGFPNPLNGHLPSRGYLRPTNELGLGLGWGSYSKNKGYHFDFSAQYDFNIFWSQNMMRETVGALQNDHMGYPNSIGNLNLHGLTLTTRLDF